MKEINILITSCGRRVELIKAFMSTRAELNIEGKVIASDMSPIAPALYFADVRETVPKLSDSEYLPRIIEICNKYNVKLIVPTIDTELQLLADNRELIEASTQAKVLISAPGVIDICNDKFKSAQFFKANDFGVPITYTEEDLDKGNYRLPLFIKPLDGSSSVNAFKVNSVDELVFFRKYIANPIVQECVEGTEYTVDAFLDFNSNVVSVVPRKRLQTRSGEILKGEIDVNPIIVNDVKRMLSLLKPIGHITVQGFMGNDGVFKYIEINPRFGGGAPMSIKAGANSCKWLYQILGGERPEVSAIADGAIFSRFDDCIMIDRYK